MAETMTRDELAAALAQYRDNDVRLDLHGVRFDLDAARYDPGHDEITLMAVDRAGCRIVLDRDPRDSMVDAVVEVLRLMIGEYVEQERPRHTPDFYAWAVKLIRHLEFTGCLPTVDAEPPAEVVRPQDGNS